MRMLSLIASLIPYLLLWVGVAMGQPGKPYHADKISLNGTWRDAYLYSLPLTRIEDFQIRTELDPVYVDAVLRAELKLRTFETTIPSSVRIEGFLFDAEGKEIPLKGFHAEPSLAGEYPVLVILTSPVKNPRKWTAETPYLYSLVIRLRQAEKIVQEFKTAIGFRQVEIAGMTLRINGVPIEIRGVVTAQTISTAAGESRDNHWIQEIRLLKEANINAIRSRWLPLEEKFLNLCDQHGIYVIPDVPYGRTKEEDPRYLPDDLTQQTKVIVDQHTNHPSVILWHAVSKNPPTAINLGGGRVALWLREHDPTRPVAVCSNVADPAKYGNTVTDLHYDPLTHVEFKEIYPTPVLFGEFHAVPDEIDRLRDKGFVETWGRSLQLEWTRFMERSWYVAGGLICGWDDGSVNGNLSLIQRTAEDSKLQKKPVYYYIRKAYAPVGLALRTPSFSAGRLNATLKVVNRYNFVNLDGFVFQWEICKESKVVASGREGYRVSPRSTFYFPLAFSVPQGADHLAFSILDPEGYCIVDQEFPLPSELTASSTDEILKKVGLQTTGPISLSPASGKLIMDKYQAICVASHQLCVNDRGGKELFTLKGFAMQPEKSRWTTMQVEPIQYLPAQGKTHSLSIPFMVKGNLIDKSKEWLISGAIRVEFGQSWIRFTYSFSSDRECVFPEAGLRLKLSSLLTQLSWNRDALNLATPKEWADNTLEQHISLKVLQAVISKRRLHWLSLEGENHMLLLIPFRSIDEYPDWRFAGRSCHQRFPFGW